MVDILPIVSLMWISDYKVELKSIHMQLVLPPSPLSVPFSSLRGSIDRLLLYWPLFPSLPKVLTTS